MYFIFLNFKFNMFFEFKIIIIASYFIIRLFNIRLDKMIFEI